MYISLHKPFITIWLNFWHQHLHLFEKSLEWGCGSEQAHWTFCNNQYNLFVYFVLTLTCLRKLREQRTKAHLVLLSYIVVLFTTWLGYIIYRDKILNTLIKTLFYFVLSYSDEIISKYIIPYFKFTWCIVTTKNMCRISSCLVKVHFYIILILFSKVDIHERQESKYYI